jgi:ribosome-associated translation inhibitor RaiA
MLSTQITFEDMERTPELSRRIQEKCESLEKLHADIHHCRVKVRPVPGPLPAHAVTVRVGVPGGELVGAEARHFDVHLAVRDAFSAMRRQLQARAQASRGPR